MRTISTVELQMVMLTVIGFISGFGCSMVAMLMYEMKIEDKIRKEYKIGE